MPVHPLLETNSAKYSSASTPTDDALTRRGKSLVTRTTSFPSVIKFFAIARMRESLVPSRKNPYGIELKSVWFNSTESVPPSGLIFIG